jgi:hypothetical protein
MLNFGDVVKLGENNYRVTRTSETGTFYETNPCACCDLRDCTENKDFDALKAKHLVQYCMDIIPIKACFKLVEQSPQVDCK